MKTKTLECVLENKQKVLVCMTFELLYMDFFTAKINIEIFKKM
jgi:hypothetical protein